VKAKLYVRAARHRRFRDSYRIETSMTYNPEPLTVGTPGSYEGQESVHTAFFALQIDVPEELLKPSAIPLVSVEIDANGATTVTPSVEQVVDDGG
jgi:hypothetical protein